MKNIIILLGPPASGKGTQSSLLAKKFSYPTISTGNLLRKEIKNESVLGNEIAKFIDNGNLVPDELIFKVLEMEFNNKNYNGFILDGFPRTLKQAQMFSDFIANSSFNLKKVFIINLDKEEILNRIGNRINCNDCGAIYNSFSKKAKVDGVCDICLSRNLINRKDDLNIEAINKRIDIFKSNISEIILFYEKKSLIFFVDGLKDVKAVNQEIVKVLNK